MNPSRHLLGLLARTLCRASLALPLMLGAAAAHATSITNAVTSSGGSWGGAGNNTWTPTAAGSVVSAAEVNGKLVAASVVKVLTHTADPTLAVEAALTLAATSQLELGSHGDIAIKAPVQAAGASLTMRYGRGRVGAGNTATIEVSAPIRLNASSSYFTSLGSDAIAAVSHTIIMDVWGLQNVNNDLSGNYVLGADIDASITAGWHGGKGFVPIHDVDSFGDGSPFVGSFDGLGHTVSALTINQWGSPYRGVCLAQPWGQLFEMSESKMR